MIVRLTHIRCGTLNVSTSNLFPPFFRRTMDTFVNLEYGEIRWCLCGEYTDRLDLIRGLVDRHCGERCG